MSGFLLELTPYADTWQKDTTAVSPQFFKYLTVHHFLLDESFILCYGYKKSNTALFFCACVARNTGS
jgi:hypothetical protein